jgi:predicted phage tail protein
MAIPSGKVAIGVFQNEDQARRAVDDLKRAGFSEDEIGFLARAGFKETTKEVATSIAAGTAGGGVIGGALAAAASLLIPGVGAVLAGGILAITLGMAGAGALVGMLTGMGLTDQEARRYQRELEEGHTIVVVKAANAHGDAVEILRRDGAYNVDTKEVDINAKSAEKSEEPDVATFLREDEPSGHVVKHSEVLPPTEDNP